MLYPLLMSMSMKISLSLLYFDKILLHKKLRVVRLVSGPGLKCSPPEKVLSPGRAHTAWGHNLSVWPLSWAPHSNSTLDIKIWIYHGHYKCNKMQTKSILSSLRFAYHPVPVFLLLWTLVSSFCVINGLKEITSTNILTLTILIIWTLSLHCLQVLYFLSL